MSIQGRNAQLARTFPPEDWKYHELASMSYYVHSFFDGTVAFELTGFPGHFMIPHFGPNTLLTTIDLYKHRDELQNKYLASWVLPSQNTAH